MRTRKPGRAIAGISAWWVFLLLLPIVDRNYPVRLKVLFVQIHGRVPRERDMPDCPDRRQIEDKPSRREKPFARLQGAERDRPGPLHEPVGWRSWPGKLRALCPP